MAEDSPDAIEVPHQSLSASALRGLVEEFVTRDGTDYGVHERDLDDRVRDVMRQLERGEVVVVFDPQSQSANIVVRRRTRG